MTRVEVLAQAYNVPASEVERWPLGVQNAMHRNAIRRGWLLAEVAA